MKRDPSSADDVSFIVGGGETGTLVRSIDWNTSRLGPVATWPQSLRTALGIALSTRFPIAIYWGPEFVMLYNDDLRPMVGANKHPQALGRPAFEVLPEIRQLIEPLLRQVVETGEPIWSEDLMLPLLRHEQQEESYFTFTYSPIRDESGAVAGVFCAVIETTDKFIEGRRLRLLNAMAAATKANDPVEACTVAATQIAGDSADVPFALLYLLDESSTTATRAAIANLDLDDPRASPTIRIGDDSIWPFGAVLSNAVPCEIAFATVTHGARGAVILPIERSGGGTPHGFIVAALSPMLRTAGSYERFHNLIAASVSQSVSNAAAHEAERQRTEALATLDRAKTTFFSNVSHEFRTPLTLMLAPIQDMLALPAGSSIDPATVALLDRNAQRLLKLVNTLLQFSRIEAGRVDAVYEPVDLSSFTVDLASSFRSVIERAGMSLVVDCPALPEPIYVDRDMWERIVLNLLSNAFKFTFTGTIGVRLRASQETVSLQVSDTGTGIAERELPHVFDRFHRIEGTRSRSHEGSGIGLALIQELARLHGGDVHATSTLGVGTTFEVQIPRGTRHLAGEHVVAPRSRASYSEGARPYVDEAMRWASTEANTETSEVETAGARPRILVADDNADMREYVARLLRERWDVDTVADGSVALASIRRDPPALVLADVMMPGLDGFALVHAIRSDPATRPIPIILLSARAGEEETARGLSSGANDYIAKPFSARELLVRTASALATARAFKEMLAREQTQRETLYRHFMQAPFPVCVFRGSNHIVELANPRILAAWGVGANVIGLPLMEAVPQLQGQGFIELLDGVFRTGVPREGHAQPARLPTGPSGATEERYFDFIYAPLHDMHGVIEGVLVSAFDVTDSVAARRGAEAAEKSERSIRGFQEGFVAILGHDLRNPLAAISMGTSLLTKTNNDVETKRVLARIVASTRRMSRMVEQILDLSRARMGGGIAIVRAPLDIQSVLTTVIDEARSAHPNRTIERRGATVIGQWDRDRLEQVFSNLIGNAIHHGLDASSVTVAVTELDDRVVVDVHNDGPAIPPETRAALFEPFRQGDRDTREKPSTGLGLGLYISREIVLSHGGEIEVRSTADEGTTFSVLLPRSETTGTP